VRGTDLQAVRTRMASDEVLASAVRHPDVTHAGIALERSRGGVILRLVTARLRTSPEDELTPAQVLEGLNRARAARGVEPLSPDPALGDVARQVAGDHLRGVLTTQQAMVDAGNAALERYALAYRRVATVVALVDDPREAFALEPALEAGATGVGVFPLRLGAGAKRFALVLTLGWER
jgi:hypothetical protein